MAHTLENIATRVVLAGLCAAYPLASLAAAPVKPSIAVQASQDNLAFETVERLTTEVGARPAGTPAEARARKWAVQFLTEKGFADVHVEPFTLEGWVRGTETASVVSPYPQPLILTALGNSASTGAAGMRGTILHFENLAALQRAEPKDVAGRIIYVGHQMRKTQDGSGYGANNAVRFHGPNIAAKKGAAAILIRSLGTDSHRNPHTGNSEYEAGVAPIPSAALANPDADTLERMLDEHNNVEVLLTLTPHFSGPSPSGNIIAEIKGRDPKLPIVLLGCHLDSWDLAPSALDDAAGCGIITAAARLAAQQRQPLRTIRLLWAGAEEVGAPGGDAYAQTHGQQAHMLAMEADFGADRVWAVRMGLDDSFSELKSQISLSLQPLGILTDSRTAHGGSDIQAIAKSNTLPLIDMAQDGTRYFDVHHSPDDTLDKIDKDQLRQAVAAWATVVDLAANYAPATQGK